MLYGKAEKPELTTIVDDDEQANVFSGFEIELFILGALRYWDDRS